MAVLLDTQTLVWSLFGHTRLSAHARAAIDATPDVLVSVASIYEIDFKRRNPARLRAQDDLLRRMPQDMVTALPAMGYVLLPIDAETAWRAARLPIEHGDPWDRILLAQALIRGVPLLSADAPLRTSAAAHPETAGVIVF